MPAPIFQFVNFLCDLSYEFIEEKVDVESYDQLLGKMTAIGNAYIHAYVYVYTLNYIDILIYTGTKITSALQLLSWSFSFPRGIRAGRSLKAVMMWRVQGWLRGLEPSGLGASDAYHGNRMIPLRCLARFQNKSLQWGR